MVSNILYSPSSYHFDLVSCSLDLSLPSKLVFLQIITNHYQGETMIQQENCIEPKFTFTSELTQATKWIEEKDSVQQCVEYRPAVNDKYLPGDTIQCQSNLGRCFETRDFLVYALIEWEGKLASNLHVHYFGKAKGENEKKKISGLKGRILCFQFSYPYQLKAHGQASQFQTKIIMGNEDGFIKIIDFSQRTQIKSFQIDTKPIVDIQVPAPESFSNHHVCFALLEDYTVYILSIRHGIVLAHFRPTIMMCDVGLSLSLHSSVKYFLQATQGGYLVLWKINENLFKRLQQIKPDSNQIKRIYNVFPTSILHSASIEGIIWASFLGDLIALITSKGVFKIIGINIEEKEEYATLLSYKIQNGHTTKSVKLLPREQCLVVVRQEGLSSVLECIHFSPLLEVRKVLRLRISQMPIFDQVLISDNFKYIFLRNEHSFFISFNKVIEESLLENRRTNDDLRQISY